MHEIRLLPGDEALAMAAAVWPCYHAVFGDVADFGTWRTDLFERHAGREGYRLAVAVDGPGGSDVAGTSGDHDGSGRSSRSSRSGQGRVVGFAWGYVGRRGQYWPDLVSEALPPDVVSEWVGGHFEFVELAVLPDHRRAGLGRLLHDRLLYGVRGRCLLGTADDPDDPAVRLYTSCGWRRLGALRSGVQVMGLDRS